MAARWNSSRAPERPCRRDKPQHLVSGRLPLQGFAELTLRMCEPAFEIATRFLRHRVVQPPAAIRES